MNRKYFNHSFIPEEEHDDEIKEEKERKRHIAEKGRKKEQRKRAKVAPAKYS